MVEPTQEFALALPFNLKFSDLNPQNINDLSEIKFELEYKISSSNLADISWRPHLKIYNHESNEWIPYIGIIKVGDKVPWDYTNDYIINSTYDEIQLSHDPTQYLNNSTSCEIIFTLSRDLYPNFDQLFDFSGEFAKLKLIGEIFAIPGIFNSEWQIQYEEYTLPPQRKEIACNLTINNSYLRFFQETDIIKKSIYHSNDIYNGKPFDRPITNEIDLISLLSEEDYKDIANLITVFGINTDPLIITPLNPDQWSFSRLDGSLTLSNEILLNFNYLNFTYEMWSDLLPLGNGIYEPNKSLFHNISLIQNVIGVYENGTVHYFPKIYERGLMTYGCD